MPSTTVRPPTERAPAARTVAALSVGDYRALVSTTTDQLQVGDLILSHGMILELDREPNVYDGVYGPVYAYSARCVNVAEVDDRFLAHFLRVDGGRWTVQGNDFARWARFPR